MRCEEFGELSELYVLGALESAEARAVNDHLAEGCEVCRAEIRRALEQNEAVFASAPLVDPPARLRRKIQETFVPQPLPRKQFPGRWFVPWAVAAAAVLALVAGVAVESRRHQTEARVLQAQSEDLARLSKMVEILEAPGTRQVGFGPADQIHPRGSVFIHQKLGIALVMGSLPKAPAGWKYESWLVRSGKPEPVEPFRADEFGRAVTIVPGPVNLTGVTAMAVSMEPQESQPVSPTKVVFAAPV